MHDTCASPMQNTYARESKDMYAEPRLATRESKEMHSWHSEDMYGRDTSSSPKKMQSEPLDTYKRVVMDHTELITRVSMVEDRVRINTCILLLTNMMTLVFGLVVWLNMV